jgi:hypothetical protein
VSAIGESPFPDRLIFECECIASLVPRRSANSQLGALRNAPKRCFLWNPHALFALGAARARHRPERAAGMESAFRGKGAVKGIF